MSELHAARTIPVDDVAEALHGLATSMAVRAQYPAGHPALGRADAAAAAGFEKILSRYHEMVLALLDGEFVINERPFPELRKRLSTLVDAMDRHRIECFVFQRGITPAECGLMGGALSAPKSEDTNASRVELQGGLAHVLLRFAALKKHDTSLRGRNAGDYMVPLVQAALDGVVSAVTSGHLVDLDHVRAVGARIVESCRMRTFVLEQRAYAAGLVDDAAHASNVATLTAAMMYEAGASDTECVEAASAALLHDIGVALLPAHVRGVPTPLLSERDTAIHRQHPVVGASALLCSGCPPLWIAAALDHHRGVDGRGYPTLENAEAPHAVVQMIALASYFDRRRTIAGGASDDPDQALRSAVALEDRYFARGTVSKFLRAVGVYPPGTVVELSNGATAIVLHANPSEPLRPQVQILFGEHAGKRFELKDLNGIEDRYGASIVRAIPPPLAVFEYAGELEEVIEEEEDVYVPEPWPEPPPASGTASLAPQRTSSAPPIPREEPSSRSLPITPALPLKVPSIVTIASLPSMPPRSMPPPVAPSDMPPPDDAIERLEPLARVPRLDVPPDAIAGLGLDPRAGFILSFVDGQLSLEDILDASGLPRAEAARLLGELITLGVLEFD